MSENDEKKKAKPKTRGYVIRIGGARDVSEKAKEDLLKALRDEKKQKKKK